MKRAVLAIVGTVCGLVMLLSFKTRPATDTGAGAEPPPAPGAASGTGATRVVTGAAIDTEYGPVQVRLTLAHGKITKARAIKFPNDRNRSVEINRFAVPRLTRETVAAQSAQIDAVSGASYTSEGYIRSLQSALDQAGR